MRHIWILFFLCAGHAFGQGIDSLNACRADSMRRANEEWLNSPMNYVDHPLYHMFDFDSMLRHIPVNASFRFELISPSLLAYLSEIVDEYDTVLVKGEDCKLPNKSWLVQYDTVYPVYMPEAGSHKYVEFPGKTLFVATPSHKYFYAFSHSKASGRWLLYAFFKGTEKHFEVIDPYYPDAGTDPEIMFHRVFDPPKRKKR